MAGPEHGSREAEAGMPPYKKGRRDVSPMRPKSREETSKESNHLETRAKAPHPIDMKNPARWPGV